MPDHLNPTLTVIPSIAKKSSHPLRDLMSFCEKENAKAIETISTVIRVEKKIKQNKTVALHPWAGPSSLLKRRPIQQLTQKNLMHF